MGSAAYEAPRGQAEAVVDVKADALQPVTFALEYVLQEEDAADPGGQLTQ